MSADELTYVPHLDTCPEHILTALPDHFKEEFDFQASQLHTFQQGIDSALERAMNSAV
jgi:hypothetical protein